MVPHTRIGGGPVSSGISSCPVSSGKQDHRHHHPGIRGRTGHIDRSGSKALGLGGHNSVFSKRRFRGLPGRPLLRSRPVSFSTVAIPLTAGLTAGLHRPLAFIERTPRCVTWCGYPERAMRDRRALERCCKRAAHVSAINRGCIPKISANCLPSAY
jgi:hypothetical protein